jgi:hypothetical protein
MLTFAALVLGSTLTVAGAADAPSDEQPVITPQQARFERRRSRMAKVHTIAGVGLEVGAGLLHVLTATTFIGHDLSCSGSASECNKGTPIVIFLPVGAIAMGWAGATRLAAAREASIWRSPMFWAGTAVTLATVPAVALLSPGQGSRNGRVAVDAALVTGFVLGNVIQVWGAMTAPPRETAVGTRSLSLTPGCGPTSGGVICGTFARF